MFSMLLGMAQTYREEVVKFLHLHQVVLSHYEDVDYNFIIIPISDSQKYGLSYTSDCSCVGETAAPRTQVLYNNYGSYSQVYFLFFCFQSEHFFTQG